MYALYPYQEYVNTAMRLLIWHTENAIVYVLTIAAWIVAWILSNSQLMKLLDCFICATRPKFVAPTVFPPNEQQLKGFDNFCPVLHEASRRMHRRTESRMNAMCSAHTRHNTGLEPTAMTPPRRQKRTRWAATPASHARKMQPHHLPFSELMMIRAAANEETQKQERKERNAQKKHKRRATCCLGDLHALKRLLRNESAGLVTERLAACTKDVGEHSREDCGVLKSHHYETSQSFTGFVRADVAASVASTPSQSEDTSPHSSRSASCGMYRDASQERDEHCQCLTTVQAEIADACMQQSQTMFRFRGATKLSPRTNPTNRHRNLADNAHICDTPIDHHKHHKHPKHYQCHQHHQRRKRRRNSSCTMRDLESISPSEMSFLDNLRHAIGDDSQYTLQMPLHHTKFEALAAYSYHDPVRKDPRIGTAAATAVAQPQPTSSHMNHDHGRFTWWKMMTMVLSNLPLTVSVIVTWVNHGQRLQSMALLYSMVASIVYHTTELISYQGVIDLMLRFDMFGVHLITVTSAMHMAPFSHTDVAVHETVLLCAVPFFAICVFTDYVSERANYAIIMAVGLLASASIFLAPASVRHYGNLNELLAATIVGVASFFLGQTHKDGSENPWRPMFHCLWHLTGCLGTYLCLTS